MTTNTKSTEEAVSLADRIGAEGFDTWYRDREFRDNIQNRTPFFNGPPPVQEATRHSPSKLLQCHRKVSYQQLNAPEEQADPKGIFWFGTQFEEDIILPYLREAVVDSETYVSNTLWIDFEIDTDIATLQIKGATDPVLVDEECKPILATEVKTKSSISKLHNPNLHHRAQVHAYLYGLSEKHGQKITDAVIIYGSRDTLDIKPFHIEFDPDFWNEILIEWVTTHTQYRLDQELPPADPQFDWECKFCDYRNRCGKENNRWADVEAEGFLPRVEYPKEQVRTYLGTRPTAKLTPKLADLYPDLAAEYGVYPLHCNYCNSEYEWEDWKGEHIPQQCPECAEWETLSGPLPAEQSVRGGSE